MTSVGQVSGQVWDNDVTLQITPALYGQVPVLPTLATLGEAAGIPGYTSFAVNPYSDTTPAPPPFSLPATPDAVPPLPNGELHNILTATAYVQRQLDEDTALLRFTRLEADAAAMRRELRELKPRTQAVYTAEHFLTR